MGRRLQATFLKLRWPGAGTAASAATTSANSGAELPTAAKVFLQTWTQLARAGAAVPEGGYRPELVGVVGATAVTVPAAVAHATGGQELLLLLPYMLEALDADRKQLPGGLAAGLWDDGVAVCTCCTSLYSDPVIASNIRVHSSWFTWN